MGTWQHRVANKGNMAIWPTLATVNISNEQPCQLATYSGRIVDEAGTLNLELHDELIVRYAADDSNFVRIFAGDLNSLTLTDMGRSDPRVYEFTAQDYTKRLEKNVIDAQRLRDESVSARVAWIMGHSSQGLTTGGVASISEVIDGRDYRGMTVREALDDVAAEIGASFYVDFDKVLHFFVTPPVVAAPFALVHPANPPTSHPYWDFAMPQAADDYAEAVYVQGDGLAVWRGTQGDHERAYSDPNIKTLRKAQRMGDRILADLSSPIRRVELTLIQPGLAPGQTVHLTNPSWGIDEDFLVQSTVIGALDPNGPDGGRMEMHVTLVDRFTPCSLRSPSAKDVARETTGEDRGPSGDDNTCQKKLVWLDSSVNQLSIHWGRLRNIFAFDGQDLQKWRPNLTRIFRREVSEGALLIYDHVPEGGNDDQRPVLLGGAGTEVAVGYHSNTGNVRWDISSELELLIGIAAQDRPRCWLVGQFPSGDEFRLQLRRGDTGAVLSEIALPDGPSRIRATPNGQHVAVASLDFSGSPWAWTIRFYDRELALVETVTVEEGASAERAWMFDDVDWAPDDDFSLYAQNYAAPYQFVTKYNRDGEELWSIDLHAENGYSYSSLHNGRAQNTLLVDGPVLRIAGHIGRTTPASTGPGWGQSSNPSDAVMVTLSRASGAILHLSRFGGTTEDDDAQACSIIRATRDGCLYLAGAVNGSGGPATLEGEEAPDDGVQQWLMRLPPVAGE